MQISLLFGTETGNTEMLCDDLQAELEADHDVDVANLQDVNPSDLDPTRFYVFPDAFSYLQASQLQT